MEISEVRVKRLRERSDRLRAFCSITIDDEFVVHDLRLIEGRKGLFVAMPSRKLADNCPKCGGKNHLRAAFCNSCGAKLDKNRAQGRDKFHVDVAHPIVTSCRDKVKEAVLKAYEEACEEDSGISDTSEPEEDNIDENDETWMENHYDLDDEGEDNDEEIHGKAADEEDEDQDTVTDDPQPHEDIAEDADTDTSSAQSDEAAKKEDEDQPRGGFGDGIL